MAFESFRNRLHRVQGERVFLEAQRALMEPPRISGTLLACYGVATLILLVPVSVICLGLWMIIGLSQHMFAILGGIVILGAGLVLLPRPHKSEERTLTRAELPRLYTLLDDVAGALGTKAPDGVQFNFDLNASVTVYGLLRRQRVLTIGVPLWQVLSPQERVGVIAHELAHFVNGDPARGVLIHAAMQTVARWDFLWTDNDTVYVRDTLTILMEGIQWLLRLPVRGAGRLLMWLQYTASQRAEYLANGLAAQVAGRDEVVALFRKFALAPLAHQAVPMLYPYSRDQNARIFDVMVTAMTNATPEQRTAFEAEQARDKTRMDQSHPPVSYLIAFLELLEDTEGSVQADRYDFDAILIEMKPEADRQGKRLMQRYEVQ